LTLVQMQDFVYRLRISLGPIFE